MPTTINISPDGWVMRVLKTALRIAVKNHELVAKYAKVDGLDQARIQHVLDMFDRAEEIEFRISGVEPFEPLDPKRVEQKFVL